MNQMNFPHKGYGRIYVENPDEVAKVEQVIKEMDAFEYDYLPDDLIAVFTGKIETTYTHKFDDLDIGLLMEKCWQQGIRMFCVTGRYGSSLID